MYTVTDATYQNRKQIDGSKALFDAGHVQKRVASLRDIERVLKVVKRHSTIINAETQTNRSVKNLLRISKTV